jgi:magnesium-transporting ATPase (P-type)
MNYEAIRKQYVVTQKFPFNSMRKRMSCIISDPILLGNKKRLVIKGASEIVLESCNRIHNLHDEVYEITQETRARISDCIDKLSSQALRTLVLAYKEIGASDGKNYTNNEKNNSLIIKLF